MVNLFGGKEIFKMKKGVVALAAGLFKRVEKKPLLKTVKEETVEQELERLAHMVRMLKRSKKDVSPRVLEELAKKYEITKEKMDELLEQAWKKVLKEQCEA
jgi:DNA-directed RNA polymerase sigma subunit (sigma70/sigma32)